MSAFAGIRSAVPIAINIVSVINSCILCSSPSRTSKLPHTALSPNCTMAIAYAKDQPLGSTNYVNNIAIVGATGRSGTFIVEALLKTGKHNVTAITRADGKGTMPSGLHEIKKVDYSSHSSLVSALKGQDVLIITMAVMAPKDTQTKLIDAAVEAGVRWVMPNEWGGDLNSNEGLQKDTFLGEPSKAIRAYIEKVGGETTHWVGLACGFWYEFSLAGTDARYGFDFEKKEVTFYDEGENRIYTSTWPQVGRAVAKLLSLKVLPEDENDKEPTLSDWKNAAVYVSSFHINQREMFESVLRATGDSEKDWTIKHENVEERYKRGLSLMQQGQMVGFGILLYARHFFDDVTKDFGKKNDNEKLGLPEESLDEATKVGVEMAKNGDTNTVA